MSEPTVHVYRRARGVARAALSEEPALTEPAGLIQRRMVDAAVEAVWPIAHDAGVATGRTTGPCCRDAEDSEGNAHAEDCRYLAGVLFGRKQASDAIRREESGVREQLEQADPTDTDYRVALAVRSNALTVAARIAEGGEPNG